MTDDTGYKRIIIIHCKVCASKGPFPRIARF
jgi:hypothetical protein